MLTLRHSVSYRNYSPGRTFQIDGIPWTSCVDRSRFNLPSELLGVFAGWSRHSRRGMATSLASFSSACLGKHPSARPGDSCPPNVILSGIICWERKDTIFQIFAGDSTEACDSALWLPNLVSHRPASFLPARRGHDMVEVNHFNKKCLQLVFLLGFSCWETLLFLSRTWERAEKVTKTCHSKGVSLCIYPLQRSKESWVPSQCCFPLLASLGQVLLLLFLFLVLLVAVAHGAWCVWTAAREPYQSDAETDSSDQEGWEESFVAFSLPHVAPAKTKWNSCKSN